MQNRKKKGTKIAFNLRINYLFLLLFEETKLLILLLFSRPNCSIFNSGSSGE